MKNWIIKNKDALLITGVGIIATVVVARTSYALASNVAKHRYEAATSMMSMMAYETGVLDKLIAHQDKLSKIIPS